MINKLISVCCLRDSATWKVASRYIVKHIRASQYELIVPDHEVDEFSKFTPIEFQVTPESVYLKEYDLTWLKAQFPSHLSFRAGWYLQQFIKIESARQGGDADLNLIWDADTVPLKTLSFTSVDGRIIYYTSDEYHLAYFSIIKKLLQLDKLVSFSFISQCFPVKSLWVNEFCREIEKAHESHWIEAVIHHLDFADGCGFSEYESIGTYLTHTHLNSMGLNPAKWERLGNSLIGSVENLNEGVAADLAKKYDFVSFENWDHGQYSLKE